MPRASATATVIFVITAGLLGACGGDDSTTTGAGGATSTTTTGTGGSAACATYVLLQGAGEAVTKLDSEGASSAQVTQAADNLSKSVQAFSSAASKAGDEVKSEVESAVSSFQSQADAAQGKPPAQRLAALGSAFQELQRQVGKTVDQLKCQ
jgi:hypothetical protein